MKKLIVVLFCVVACASLARASSSDAEAALDTIAQINHINWVVNTIKTYNNALVLEEEYEKISPGRLNLNRIPDQETMNRIVEMLDQLHALRMQERDLKRWKEDFDLLRRRKIRQFYLEKGHALKDNLVSIFCSGQIVSSVIATSRDSIGVYNDYSCLVEDIECEANKHVFDLDTEKLTNLHEQNKKLLQDQWNMIRKYNFDDSLRVADTDINLLISFLKDDDHDRVYSRIEPMRDKFKLFPVYWYYLSSVAMETGHRDVGLEACDIFFKVNRNLFRDDFMLGAVAMNRAVMMEKTDANKSELRKYLDLSWKNNAGYGDWRRDYILASLYYENLKDAAMAEKVIQHAIASIETKMEELLSRDAGGLVDTVLGENLWFCRRFLEDIKGDKFKFDEARLNRVCSDMLTSSIEKLFYLGRMPTRKLWDLMKDDILSISVERSRSVGLRGIRQTFEIAYPVKWLLTGGVEVKFAALDGERKVAELSEDVKSRTMDSNRLLHSKFEIASDVLDKADSFELRFCHKDYPVSLRFASRSPYVNEEKASAASALHTGIMDGKFSTENLANDLSLFVVSFGGKKYCRDFINPNVVQFSADSQAKDSWLDAIGKVFENLIAIEKGSCEGDGLLISVGRDGVASVKIDVEGGCVIKYQNNEENAFRPKVSIFALNEFGSVIGRVDDAWKIKKLKPGMTAESKRKMLTPLHKLRYLAIETSR